MSKSAHVSRRQRETLPQSSEAFGSCGEIQGERLVLSHVFGDQLREARGPQQAGTNAARKGITSAV